MEDFGTEIKNNKSNQNYKNILDFLPFYLERKFKFMYSNNNQTHISDFMLTYTNSFEFFLGKSKEVGMLSQFFAQDAISHRKIAFYVKARKSIINFLYYSKQHPSNIDNVDLTLNEWSTLTNRLFNDYKNFNQILKGVTEKVKEKSQNTHALQKKNYINAIDLLEIWLEFFEKAKLFTSFKSPKKFSPLDKRNESPQFKKNAENNSFNEAVNSDTKSFSKNEKNNGKTSSNQSFMSPPNSYYKEMMQVDKYTNSNSNKKNNEEREEKMMQSLITPMNSDSNNFMTQSSIGMIEIEGEKLRDFLKSDSNKFKVFPS